MFYSLSAPFPLYGGPILILIFVVGTLSICIWMFKIFSDPLDEPSNSTGPVPEVGPSQRVGKELGGGGRGEGGGIKKWNAIL